MASLELVPFLTLRDDTDAVETSAWRLLDFDGVGGDLQLSEGSTIPGWSYDTLLRLGRSLTVHPGRLRDETGLCRSSTIRIAASCCARAGVNHGVKRQHIDISLEEDDAVELGLEFDLGSPQLAGQLEVIVAVVVTGRDDTMSSQLAARVPGSVLWQDRTTLRLEGGGSRMPIVPTDFGTLQTSEREAAWYVWTGPDWLAQHVSAGLVVHINAARPAVVAALTTRRPSQAEMVVRSALYHDVGRILVERALADEEFTDETEFPLDSAGRVFRSKLKVFFGCPTLRQVREVQQQDPERFERVLQARHGFLGVIS